MALRRFKGLVCSTTRYLEQQILPFFLRIGTEVGLQLTLPQLQQGEDQVNVAQRMSPCMNWDLSSCSHIGKASIFGCFVSFFELVRLLAGT